MANPPKIRNYEDLRFKFIRGLTSHEHQQRRHQFLKQAAEWTSKAIVSLSLTEEPIRSAKQATQLEGVGATIRARLNKIQSDKSIKSDPPKPGQHTSTGSGLLVALLNESEAIVISDGGKPLVPEPDLKEACLSICEEKFNKTQPSVDGTPVLCPAWWRINVLISRGYVKKRTRGKQAVFELLPEGEQIAKRLRGTHLPPVRIQNPLPKQSPSVQSRKKTPSTNRRKTQDTSSANNVQEPSSTNNVQDTSSANNVQDPSSSTSHFGPLYCHDNGSDGVIMLVDNHELGGDRVRLGELSRRLKEWDVPHKTTHLPCGDYLWLWRKNGKEVTLPIIVERKRADDFAESMKDGRFWSQKKKMIEWRKEFGMLSDEVSLHYVVESSPAAYRVRCMDGCNGVAKCGNPTVQQVEVAMEELDNNPDFTLTRTENVEVTVEYLASMTAELHARVRNGDFEVLRLMQQDRSSPHSARHSKSYNKVTATVTKNSSVDLSSTALAPRKNDATASFSRSNHAEKSREESLMDDKSQSRTKKNTNSYDYSYESRLSPAANVCPGSKRRMPYMPIDIDDVIDDPAKRKKTYVDVLSDSQEDFLLMESPFGSASSTSNSTKHPEEPWSSPRSSSSAENTRPSYSNHEDTDNKSSSREYQSTNQRAPSTGNPKDVNHDEEAKLVQVRDVMPDARLEDVLSALSSARGNVELAVSMLLDSAGNYIHEERCKSRVKKELHDLTL